MSQKKRLNRLGLTELADKPEELAREVKKKVKVIEEKNKQWEKKMNNVCPIDNETECTKKNKELCRGCDKVCSDDDWKNDEESHVTEEKTQ